MRLGLALIAAAAGAAGIGCGLSQDGIGPPANRIFFPGAIKVDPTTTAQNRWLYVANSNADLRFNDGTLAVIDLAQAATDYSLAMAARDDSSDPNYAALGTSCPNIGFDSPLSPVVALGTPFCCWDLLDDNVLDCDERAYIDPAVTVRIGSFTAALEVMTMDDWSQTPVSKSTTELFVAVRGNSSITVVDASATSGSVTLSCTGGPGTERSGTFAECGSERLVNQVVNTSVNQVQMVPPATAIVLPAEPYAMAIDPEPAPAPGLPPIQTQNLLYVGHLVGGFLSLIDLTDLTVIPPQKPQLPKLIDVAPPIFPPDLTNSTGVTSFTVKTPGVGGAVYATSRFLPRVGSFAANAVGNPPVFSPSSESNLLLGGTGDTFVTNIPGSETRGIQFFPEVNRAFVLQRSPPTLVAFDTSVPGINTPFKLIELCDSPIFLNKHSVDGTDATQRLYVTCSDAGEVYVIDPYALRVAAIIEVGREPAGLDFAVPVAGDPTTFRAYVNGFGSNNVSVIDLFPGSPTENHVIQRIGFPNPEPR